MFRFSTSIRTQDNITSHFCLIARRIGTPYHQMIISGSSIGRNNNIMMMYFCILQTGNIIYLVKSKSCVFLSGCPGIMSVVVKIIMNIDLYDLNITSSDRFISKCTPFPLPIFNTAPSSGSIKSITGFVTSPFSSLSHAGRQTEHIAKKADYKKIKFCFHFNNCLNGTLIEI